MRTIIRRSTVFALALAAPPVLLEHAPARESSSPARAEGGRIVATGAMHVPRASHTSTLLPDGRVLLAGGFGGSGTERAPYATTELYDPVSGTFVPGLSMSHGRLAHTATLLQDGKVLIAGGRSGGETLAGAELYDPTTGRFAPTGGMAEPRAGHTATLLPDGTVLIAGGVDFEENALASAEIYDPTRGRFTPAGALSVPRTQHTATLLASGKVLIAGGGSGHYPSQTVYSSAELFDPAQRTFAPTRSMAVPRHKHAAVTLPSGQVLIVGGSDSRDWEGAYATAELYDPSQGVFEVAGQMSVKRFKLRSAVTALDDGSVLIAGGGEHAEVYDGTTGRFSPVHGTLNAPRFFATATLLRDGRVLVSGGYSPETGRGLPSTVQASLYVP